MLERPPIKRYSSFFNYYNHKKLLEKIKMLVFDYMQKVFLATLIYSSRNFELYQPLIHSNQRQNVLKVW